MSTQPEALRLAAFCDGNVLYQPAAAELRRQHAALAKYEADDVRYMAELRRLHSVNAELLAALEACIVCDALHGDPWVRQKVRAAIDQATGAAS